MQYILSEKEYKDLMPRDKHREIVDSLLELIDTCNASLLKGTPCWQNMSNGIGTCNKCPISKFGTDSCGKPNKVYT